MDEWERQLERERLHFAVQDGDEAEVRRLLAGGEPANRFDELGNTPLHYAAAAENFEIARILLAAGADINAHDERVIGDTPLGAIAQSCRLEVAEFLINAGADPRISGWMGTTALDRAARRTRPEGRRIHALLREAAQRRGR